MGTSHGTNWGRKRVHVGHWGESKKENGHWEGQDVGGWLILKRILER
jgi:hypothetical protein